MLAPPGGIPAPHLEWGTNDIDMLRISGSDGDLFMVKMHTTKIDRRRSRDERAAEETRTSEKMINHVPDMARVDKDFNWEYRSLVTASFDFPDRPEYQKYEGWWGMYKWDYGDNGNDGDEPSVGSRLQNFKKNPYFHDIPEANAVGNVYVFRLKGKTPDKWKRLEYVESWPIPEDDAARYIFGTLARCK